MGAIHSNTVGLYNNHKKKSPKAPISKKSLTLTLIFNPNLTLDFIKLSLISLVPVNYTRHLSQIRRERVQSRPTPPFDPRLASPKHDGTHVHDGFPINTTAHNHSGTTGGIQMDLRSVVPSVP